MRIHRLGQYILDSPLHFRFGVPQVHDKVIHDMVQLSPEPSMVLLSPEPSMVRSGHRLESWDLHRFSYSVFVLVMDEYYNRKTSF